MSSVAQRLVSEHEFLSLPESLEKTELLDGEVVVSPSPNFAHQEILRRLVFALNQWAERTRTPVTVCQAPLDVRFGPNRILQPDAFVIFDKIPLEHTGPIQHVPQLCIEVLSNNRLYDRVTKRFIYAEAGVAEYCTIEPAGLIERWSSEGLTEREEITERLTSELLPGFELHIAELCSSLRA